MVQTLVERFEVFCCVLRLSRISHLSPTPLCRQQHWLLSPVEKKWRDMTSCLLLLTPITIVIAENLLCMTFGTRFGSLHNHPSFVSFCFLVLFKVFLRKNKQNKAFQFLGVLTCLICTFSSSILRAWDHRLNYDVHSFTTEIRMTDEDIL